MCGIFGAVNSDGIDERAIRVLVKQAKQRGRDSSGIVMRRDSEYHAYCADFEIDKLLRRVPIGHADLLFGHSRLITNGTSDNQPVLRDSVVVVHNGIVVNHEKLWNNTPASRELSIDTEIIPAIIALELAAGKTPDQAANKVLEVAEGVVACAALIPERGELILFSNNGSLYAGDRAGGIVFSSERYPLEQLEATDIRQIRDAVTYKVPVGAAQIPLKEWSSRTIDLVPGLSLTSAEESLLEFPKPEFRRCTKCILPETMPFIQFDEDGVCNYCANYRIRNHPRPKKELFDLVEPYRRAGGDEVLVPFSGGRDSSFALHLIVKELGLKPITYTYDWGMVTDLGRRNISRMSARLGVENIIVAADITKKRDNIRRNLTAWLKSPHLGMLSVLTAGDKHFFRHIETVKKETGLQLNLWGINPLEVTHFKAGFLGVPPDFAEERVYSHGAMKQLRYQRLRSRAMLQSPGYFNRSLWDTLSGEYYRSFTEKSDYFHVFDYWRWDEHEINNTLLGEYDWELAPDTSTTWRIGDGTAGFYNYAYFTIAGFTEHDTFRSNQIREGDITREEALRLVADENAPRYANIKWYLDVLGIDFKDAIREVNNAPRLYET
ncbi:glucosamine 6-phosphate synthetase [Glaciibacter superstes]|uniref:glucosamine 6-phosphate synthetase n=1 Tax=Glaciibacter superstes TaxID=501023 RepID=UPI0003B50D01|nr:glucosamine 6-phosphate synthetase [Glaciibacter superstes]